MNKKVIVFIGIIFIIALFFGLKNISNKKVKSPSATADSAQTLPTNPQKENNPSSQNVLPADKIEVVHFHGTHQCWSCITVGEYALATIKDKFPEEYRSGKIVFKDINGELPENREIVVKYQARGSSLFINAIREGKDNIQEEVRVWYLVNDKEKFGQYFENKLKDLLGK